MENSRKEGGFIWIFNFCCSLRILGLLCGVNPPGRIFYDQNMVDFPFFFSPSSLTLSFLDASETFLDGAG